MSIERHEQHKLSDLADRLDKLQAVQNNGRGVVVVRDVVTALKQGNLELAQIRYLTDRDKIRQYSDIYRIMEEELVAGHPQSEKEIAKTFGWDK